MKLTKKIKTISEKNDISEGNINKVFSGTAIKWQRVNRQQVKKFKLELYLDLDQFKKDASEKMKSEIKSIKKFGYDKKEEKIEIQKIKDEYESDEADIKDEFKNIKNIKDVLSVSLSSGDISFDPPNKYIKLKGNPTDLDDLSGYWDQGDGEVTIESEGNFKIQGY